MMQLEPPHVGCCNLGMGSFVFFVLIFLFSAASSGQTLDLPSRPANAPDGDLFIQKITNLDLAERDREIAAQILAGNVPDFLRKFCPVTVTNLTKTETNIGTFFVAPDYLAVGSDTNYFLAPISPATAQQIADKLHCILPTRKMVNAIYTAAEAKLTPSPIPPSPAMITVPVFAQHNETVRAQRMAVINAHPPGALAAGHKKDLVITARLATVANKVAIYGWHQTNGTAIQPLYLGHVWWWVDYSQCARLVADTMLVNGEHRSVHEVLADPGLCGLLSDEGVLTNARYPTSFTAPIPKPEPIALSWPEKFSPAPVPGEWMREVKTADEVRVVINAPAPEKFPSNRPVWLIFYALPNGGTVEEAAGKKMTPAADWHFDIQHIGAQTRWLRHAITNRTIVIAYLEAGPKSWPAWRQQHGDGRFPQILDGVRGIFSGRKLEVTLAGHSGGGSLIFGCLNTVEKIPADITRIAFLDSDYAYDSRLDADKFENWLAASDENRLCVLAYQDYVALLNGKTFVSEAGGTWGRSHVFLNDLSAQFYFTSHTNNGLEIFSALNGRAQFLLKENPEKKILHTVQVELNGFIHAMLSGTPLEDNGYQYFGERAYTNWIY